MAYHLADHGLDACTEFRARLPPGYADLSTVSDHWSPYALVFDPNTHRSCAKQAGQTNHVERLYATLRNHSGRLTRKTLAFSKSQANLQVAIHAFLLAYNQRRAVAWIKQCHA